MSGNAIISINAVPDAYPVTGGGSFCSGSTGVPVKLGGSRVGINYQLYKGTTAVGSAMTGNGTTLNFGIQTSGGNYTVVATNRATLCANTMTGGATVTVNPLPSIYYVTGGGTYCSGGSGVNIGLSGSDLNISYQLYKGSSAAGSPVLGSGSAIDFGLQAASGTYTIVALDQATPCSSNMLGSTNVSSVAPPAVYAVTGGGTYCEGSAAPHIRLSGSNTGIKYQLTSGGAPVGSALPGTNLGIDFGAQTASGTYAIVATNAANTCSINMAGSPMVTANPSPVIYPVTGGGTSCSAGPGVLVGLIGSDLGVNYQLYNNGTIDPRLPVGGTGAPLDFSPRFISGTYTIVGTNTTNGCTNSMLGNALVNIIPSVVPVVNITSSRGDTMCVGLVDTFDASSVNGGTAPAYQWSINGVNVSSGSSRYIYVPADGDNVSAMVTSNATCLTSATASGTKRMNVIIYQMPAATATASPSNTICKGTTVTFNATEVNGGSAPVYSWVKNSNIVGTGLSYSDAGLNTNDVVTFMLNSSLRCHSADTVFSNAFNMQVDKPLVMGIKVIDRINDKVIVGHIDTLIATDTVAGNVGPYTYQWFVNGAIIPGAISRVYVNNSIFDGDIMRCDVTSANACGDNLASGSLKVLHLRNTGINSLASNIDVNVIPNPSKGLFTIKGSLGTTEDMSVSVEITNMLGQVVYKTELMAQNGNINEQVSLNNGVANGMYLLSLRSGVENKVFHIVIEK